MPSKRRKVVKKQADYKHRWGDADDCEECDEDDAEEREKYNMGNGSGKSAQASRVTTSKKGGNTSLFIHDHLSDVQVRDGFVPSRERMVVLRLSFLK
jgi:hypothetical protein